MLSFDRGGTNLSAVWNEINSIKVDTLSLYTMITAGGGVIPEELLNSITLLTSNTGILSSDITSLNNNTSYFNNELYSLKTDTSSMISDTNALNMDVVSLYNICSSLSDSISTITGGGGSGGGPYYLAYSDAIASSLSFVYNMTGDIPSLAYDNVKFCGSIGTFANYTIPSSLNKFTLSDFNVVSKISFAKTTSVDAPHVFISLDGNIISANTFNSFGFLDLHAASFYNNSISKINSLKCGCFGLNSNTFSFNTGLISGDSFVRNYIYSHNGFIDFPYMVNNSFRYCLSINAVSFMNNDYDYNLIGVLNIPSFYANTFRTNGITPNINAYLFINNSVALVNDITINAIDSAGNNTFSGSIDTDITFSTISTSDINLNINVRTYMGNYAYSLNELNISCIQLNGLNSFNNINTINFKKLHYFLNFISRPGRTYTYINSFNNIKLINATNAGSNISCCCEELIGIETMKLNYNWKWIFASGYALQNVQPSNIYTLDFYNCDDYISNSTFTIPSYYSGYDEGNVWISGKPLSELGYTLSVSS